MFTVSRSIIELLSLNVTDCIRISMKRFSVSHREYVQSSHRRDAILPRCSIYVQFIECNNFISLTDGDSAIPWLHMGLSVFESDHRHDGLGLRDRTRPTARFFPYQDSDSRITRNIPLTLPFTFQIAVR